MKFKKIKNALKDFFKNLFLEKGGQRIYLNSKRIEEHKNEMLLKHYHHYPLTF